MFSISKEHSCLISSLNAHMFFAARDSEPEQFFKIEAPLPLSSSLNVLDVGKHIGII